MTSDELFALKPQLEAVAKAAKILKRLDRMHHLYGQTEGRQCGDCQHFVSHSYANTYHKCRLYGISHGPATDWRVRYAASGRFEEHTA